MEQNEQSPSSSIVYYGPDIPTGRGPTAHVSAFTSGGMIIHFRAGLGELSASIHLTADGCLALADELVAGAASLGFVRPAAEGGDVVRRGNGRGDCGLEVRATPVPAPVADKPDHAWQAAYSEIVSTPLSQITGDLYEAVLKRAVEMRAALARQASP